MYYAEVMHIGKPKPSAFAFGTTPKAAVRLAARRLIGRPVRVIELQQIDDSYWRVSVIIPRSRWPDIPTPLGAYITRLGESV